MEVFNFEVEDSHTYFVSDSFFLVHNANCGSSGSTELSDEALRNFGKKGYNSGFRITNGTHDDAMQFVKSQTKTLTEYSPGKYMGQNSRGVVFRVYPKVQNQYTSIRIQGVEHLKGIKFIWPKG